MKTIQDVAAVLLFVLSCVPVSFVVVVACILYSIRLVRKKLNSSKKVA